MYKAKVGQVWVAADGGDYGYTILKEANEVGDVLVHEMKPSTGCITRAKPRMIDEFKLNYRYMSPEREN